MSASPPPPLASEWRTEQHSSANVTSTRPTYTKTTVINEDVIRLLCRLVLILTVSLLPIGSLFESKANANLLTCSTHWKIQLK